MICPSARDRVSKAFQQLMVSLFALVISVYPVAEIQAFILGAAQDP